MFSFVLWEVTPEIFKIGDFAIRWYGLLFALGFLIGQQLLIRIYKWEGRSEKEVETLTVYMVIATVIGARLGHVLFYQPEYYFQHPLEILQIWKGGLASHGAAIGILVAIYLYTRKYTGQSYLYLLDRLVITVAFAGCLIRLGNLMNSEIIGKPTNFPTAFIFVHNAESGLKESYPALIRNIDIVKNGRDTTIGGFKYTGLNILMDLTPGDYSKERAVEDVVTTLRGNSYFLEDLLTPATLHWRVNGDKAIIPVLGIPRHPAQIYESVSCFFIFLLLFGIYKRKKENTPEGRLFGLFIVLVFTLRFLYEFLKAPQVNFERSMVLNMGQLLSIPLVIAGLYILIQSYRKQKKIS